MSALTLKVVPVHDFDVAELAAIVRRTKKNQVEIDGEPFPLDEDLDAATQRLDEIERGIAALTPEQRAASRWASADEIGAALRQLGQAPGFTCTLPPPGEPWDEACVSKSRRRTMLSYLNVFLERRDGQLRYYLEGDEGLLAKIGQLLAEVAGAQVTYLADTFSPVGWTALYLPTTKR